MKVKILLGLFILILISYPISAQDSENKCIGSNCPCSFPYIRGDANDDNSIDIADPIKLLNYLFTGGDGPPCLDAGDVNGDERLDITDAVYLLNYLFLGGPEPTPDRAGEGTQDPPRLEFLGFPDNKEEINQVDIRGRTEFQLIDLGSSRHEFDLLNCKVTAYDLDGNLNRVGETMIINTEWSSEDSESKGGSLTLSPMKIHVDLPAGVYELEAKCIDHDRLEDTVSIRIKSSKLESEEISLKDEESILLLTDPLATSELPSQDSKACCSVTCQDELACAQTTESDCTLDNDAWKDKDYKVNIKLKDGNFPVLTKVNDAQDLCQKAHQKNANNVEYKSDKRCNINTLKCVGECRVDTMKILTHKSQANQIPKEFNFLKFGEVYNFLTTTKENEVIPIPEDMIATPLLGPNEGVVRGFGGEPYLAAFGFLVVANLLPESDPNGCYHYQFIKGDHIYRGKDVRLWFDLTLYASWIMTESKLKFSTRELYEGETLANMEKDERLLNKNEMSNKMALYSHILRMPSSCNFGSDTWCPDDYKSESIQGRYGGEQDVMKHIKGSESDPPKIAWYDNPGSQVGTIYRALHGPDSQGNYEDVVTAPLKLSEYSFIERKISFFDWVEDSGPREDGFTYRAVCRIPRIYQQNKYNPETGKKVKTEFDGCFCWVDRKSSVAGSTWQKVKDTEGCAVDSVN